MPENIVSLSNLLEVRNDSPFDMPLEGFSLRAGDIDLDEFVIPEPTSVAALAVGLLGFALKRKK